MPEIRYCSYCKDEEIELKLIGARPSNLDKEILLTTYKCPRCDKLHYDGEGIQSKVKQN